MTTCTLHFVPNVPVSNKALEVIGTSVKELKTYPDPEQVKMQLTQLKVQVEALEKHVKECEDELGEENEDDGNAVSSDASED